MFTKHFNFIYNFYFERTPVSFQEEFGFKITDQEMINTGSKNLMSLINLEILP